MAIRLGNHIRLTGKDIDRFTKITGLAPANIKTRDDLEAYIGQCKRHYWGVSEDTRFLHWLIDREHWRCLDGG